MNWEAIGAIGEIVGAFGVIVTLIYLALQIKQNSKTIEAQMWVLKTPQRALGEAEFQRNRSKCCCERNFVAFATMFCALSLPILTKAAVLWFAVRLSKSETMEP